MRTWRRRDKGLKNHCYKVNDQKRLGANKLAWSYEKTLFYNGHAEKDRALCLARVRVGDRSARWCFHGDVPARVRAFLGCPKKDERLCVNVRQRVLSIIYASMRKSMNTCMH